MNIEQRLSAGVAEGNNIVGSDMVSANLSGVSKCVGQLTPLNPGSVACDCQFEEKLQITHVH